MTREEIKIKYQIDFDKLREVISDPSRSRSSRLLIAILLLKYARTNNNAFPSQETLAKDMGLSSRQIRNLLNELEACGLLTWKRLGFSKSNRYNFNKEVYFRNGTQPISKLRKPSSSLSGNKIPMQNGSVVPSKVIHEENHVSSNHLLQLFFKANKGQISEIEQRKFSHYVASQNPTLVEHALNKVINRGLGHVTTGYLSPIVEELNATGIPEPKPEFIPCGQNGCEKGFWFRKEDQTYVECDCHADYENKLKVWKQNWGEQERHS